MAAGYSGTLNLAGDDEPPQSLLGGFVTANAFEGLAVSPILGRSFQEGDDLPGAPNILLLGFDTWNNRFAADRNVLGRGVRVNGEPSIIIGVMPEGFGFTIVEDAWTPLRYDPATLPRAGGRILSVWGYLGEGVSRGAANAELRAIMSRLESEFPELNEKISAHAVPYAEGALPPVARVIADLMLLMVAGVLLVACANVANLLLARATAREREVAIRTALGASRLRVIRQLLAEALVIGIAGGFLGLLFNYLALQWFTVHVADIQAPYWVDYSLDPSVLIFTATVTVVAGLLAGALPAIRASGTGVEIVLRDESRGSSSLRMGRFGSGLVVAELALSCALMIGAGLVARSVMTLNRIYPGFRVESIMTSRLALFATDYPERDARNRFYHDVLAAIRSDAATTATALTSHLPGTGQARWRVQVEGATYPLPDDVPRAGGAVISHGFFETFGIATAEGRDFLPSESEMGGEPVAIVSRGFVERHMGGASALGRRIRLGANPNEANPWMRIVGVVPETYQGMGRFGTEEQIQELIYLPLALAHPSRMSMAVRARNAAPASRHRGGSRYSPGFRGDDGVGPRRGQLHPKDLRHSVVVIQRGSAVPHQRGVVRRDRLLRLQPSEGDGGAHGHRGRPGEHRAARLWEGPSSTRPGTGGGARPRHGSGEAHVRGNGRDRDVGPVGLRLCSAGSDSHGGRGGSGAHPQGHQRGPVRCPPSGVAGRRPVTSC